MTENAEKIIFLVGHSNAGKTMLGRDLSKQLNLAHISIGEFVDACAREEGFINSVDLFQKKGTVVSWNRLLPKFLKKINSIITQKGIIIDGPYSVSVVKEITKKFKAYDVFMYSIAAPRSIRIQRAKQRFGEKGKSMARERDKHRQLIGIAKVIKQFKPMPIRSKNPIGLQEKFLTALNARQGLIRKRRP